MMNCILGSELISDLMHQPGALHRQLIGHAISFVQLHDLGIALIQSSQTVRIGPDGIGEHTHPGDHWGRRNPIPKAIQLLGIDGKRPEAVLHEAATTRAWEPQWQPQHGPQYGSHN